MLPNVSTNDEEKLKMGLDFLGVNHYTSYYVQNCLYSQYEPGVGGNRMEGLYRESFETNGVPLENLYVNCIIKSQSHNKFNC